MGNTVEGISIKLTPEKAEELFHNSLCNGSQIRYYGLSLDYKESDYKKAKTSWQKKNPASSPCCEDVWMEILRIGGSLTLIDEENGGEYTKSITLKDVHERVADTPIKFLMDAINEQDDADTADVMIQTVFYKDVIFG